MVDIVLPPLGEGIVKATVVCWHVKEGELLTLGQDICEVVTDKATFNIESPADGVLNKILVDEGKDVHVGGMLGDIA